MASPARAGRPEPRPPPRWPTARARTPRGAIAPGPSPGPTVPARGCLVPAPRAERYPGRLAARGAEAEALGLGLRGRAALAAGPARHCRRPHRATRIWQPGARAAGRTWRRGAASHSAEAARHAGGDLLGRPLRARAARLRPGV